MHRLTRLSLKPFSLTARLFHNRNTWSFSVRIFRASGGGRGTAAEGGRTSVCEKQLAGSDGAETSSLSALT